MNKKKLVLLVAAIGFLALFIMYLQRMPGRFIYSEDSGAMVAKNWCMTQRLRTDNEYCYERSGATLAPDGSSLAYAREVSDFIGAIVVKSLDRSAQMDGDEGSSLDRSIDVTMYRIPYCPGSNVQWSPDGKQIAYAATHRLYIINLADGKVISAKIPVSPSIDGMESEWVKYYKGPASAKSIIEAAKRAPVKKQSGAWNYDSNGVPYPTQSDAQVKYWDKIEDDLSPKGANDPTKLVRNARRIDEKKSDKLSPAALAIVEQTRQRVRAFLQSPKYDVFLNTWQEMYYLDDMRAEWADLILSKRYIYMGHRITWCSGNFILCGDYQLNLEQTPSSLKIKAVKLPVLAEFNVRPVWNYQGDRAAYLLPEWGVQMGHTLIIVDRGGKILSKRFASSLGRQVQWSRDGRYVALHDHSFSGKSRSGFSVYDTRGHKHWRVTRSAKNWSSPSHWTYDY